MAASYPDLETLQLMNITEASIYTGLHRATLWRIIREHGISTHADDRDKRAVCVRREDIERFRNTRTSRRVLEGLRGAA